MSLVVVAHRVISRGAAAIQVAIGAPELRVGWRSRPRDGRAGNIGSKTAGTNLGAPASLAIGWRACRRQVNTCCGISPFRRATSETTAPGTSFSSTIPALKILREPAPPASPRNHLQPSYRCRLWLKGTAQCGEGMRRRRLLRAVRGHIPHKGRMARTRAWCANRGLSTHGN